jgi:hypothetical protein
MEPEGLKEYQEHQNSTRYTQPGKLHTQRGTEKPQHEERKRSDFLRILKLRIMATYINEYWHKQIQCSRFHQNVLPEDGPVRLKYVARHRIYFKDILRTF